MFGDLDEFFDGDLQVKIRGRVYRIKQPNAGDGLRLAAFFADGGNSWTDEEELAEMRQLAGETWHEMRAHLKHTEMMHACRTALIHFGLGAAAAQTYWGGGPEEADAANPFPPPPPQSRMRRGLDRLLAWI